MNPEFDSINKQDMSDELDLNDAGSIDDFLKELEEKEKDLHLSSEFVVEIDDNDIQDTELEELEKLLATIEPNKNLGTFNPPTFNPIINSNSKTCSDLEAEIEKLNREMSKISAERSEIAETMRRRSTDFENFKNRTERERAETFRSVLSNLATKVFPVIDNLERALQVANYHGENKSQDFQQFIEGVEMINRQLSSALSDMGIKQIVAVGEPFNPHFHEAVSTIQTDEFPPNTVVEELLRGYQIDDKVVRPSMVKVSS